MLLRTGVIGVGNMGNMVAGLANTKQMPVLGLNTSEQDLDAVKSSSAIDCMFIGGSGAGKDRSRSKEYMKKYITEMIGDDKMKNFIDKVDVVFVVSSTGGGTGSGACPMLADILNNYFKQLAKKNQEEPKRVVLVGALPTIDESIGAQANTIEYISEVTKTGIPYMLYDNANSGKQSTSDTFDKINNDVVHDICVIRGDYNRLSKYGMIDTRDMTNIISEPGLLHINSLEGIYEEKIPTDGTIEDLVIESMKHNTMVTLDRDKIVKNRGYIVNLSSNLQSYFNEALPKITEKYGEPMKVYDHYAINADEDERANYVIIMQSGMSLPENRLKSIQHRIDAAEESILKQKDSSILDSLTEKIAKYNPKQDEDASDFDLNDIMGKY